jgi:cytidylate kinase
MNAFPPSFIVTLDGPAGVGKSTLAKRLAQALGIVYLDTGAMFRSLALFLHDAGWRPGAMADDDASLADLLEGCVFSLRGEGADAELLRNGKPVDEAIRDEKAGMMAADIAVLPQVRDFLKKAQQRLGSALSLVAEGRDMGTAIFPSASCKIFLEADADIRAERRCRQLQEMGKPCDLAELAEHIRRRDQQDRNRPVAPLVPAADAVIIDTSRMGIEEVFNAMLRIVATKLPPAPAMRRKDRALSRKESLALLAKGEYGMLATTGADGWPYAVPLSYVLMDGAVYFHCAFSGHKISNLALDNRVCFTVAGATRPMFSMGFTTCYESVVIRGRAFAVSDKEEKNRSLRMLAEKYLPEHMDKFEESVNRSAGRTAVYKITLEQVSGKARRG